MQVGRNLFIQNNVSFLCYYAWKKGNFPSQTWWQWEKQIHAPDSPLSIDMMSYNVLYIAHYIHRVNRVTASPNV